MSRHDEHDRYTGGQQRGYGQGRRQQSGGYGDRDQGRSSDPRSGSGSNYGNRQGGQGGTRGTGGTGGSFSGIRGNQDPYGQASTVAVTSRMATTAARARAARAATATTAAGVRTSWAAAAWAAAVAARTVRASTSSNLTITSGATNGILPATLDDDYYNWRQDRYKKFSDEFSTWRKNRPSASRKTKGSSSGSSSSDSDNDSLGAGGTGSGGSAARGLPAAPVRPAHLCRCRASSSRHSKRTNKTPRGAAPPETSATRGAFFVATPVNEAPARRRASPLSSWVADCSFFLGASRSDLHARGCRSESWRVPQGRERR